MATGYFTRRSATCKQVLNMLQEKGVVMMRAPPHSGKTSLCQLVALTAKANHMFQQVFYISCAAVNIGVSFSEQFHRMCGATFDEAAKQASAFNRTVIIIDKLRELTMQQQLCGAGPSMQLPHQPTVAHDLDGFVAWQQASSKYGVHCISH